MPVLEEHNLMTLSSENGELSFTDSEECIVPSSANIRYGRRHVFATIGGTVALAMLALLHLDNSGPPARNFSTSKKGMVTARGLLEDADILDVAAQNLIKAGGKWLTRDDIPLLRDLVANRFHNISIELMEHTPQLAKELDGIQLNEEQKGAVLQMMRAITDPRVQRLGLHVAHVVRKSRSKNQKSLENEILQMLVAKHNDMRELREEVFPMIPPMTQWHVSYDSQALRVMATFDDKWDFELSASSPDVLGREVVKERNLQQQQQWQQQQQQQQQPQRWPFLPSRSTAPPSFFHVPAPSTTTTPGSHGMLFKMVQRGLGIFGAVSEEASFLIESAQLLSRLFDHPITVSPWAETVTGGLSAASQLASCEMAHQNQQKPVAGFVQCLFNLGTVGMRALHLSLGSAGIDRDYGNSGVTASGQASSSWAGTPVHRAVGVFS